LRELPASASSSGYFNTFGTSSTGVTFCTLCTFGAPVEVSVRKYSYHFTTHDHANYWPLHRLHDTGADKPGCSGQWHCPGKWSEYWTDSGGAINGTIEYNAGSSRYYARNTSAKSYITGIKHRCN
jgi:hypothetical protein